MQTIILSHETVVRIGSYGVLFVLLAVCEVLVPRRLPARSKLVRWYSNLGIHGLDSLVVR